MGNYRVLMLLLLLFCGGIEGGLAVEYTVNNTAENTPGGAKFYYHPECADFARETMAAVSTFIWETFQQNNPADRKNVDPVGLFIDDMDGVAHTIGDNVHFSARFINEYGGNTREMFTGVMYHEMTHVWQWNNGAPSWVIEGIADFVRLKAGHPAENWVQPGQGNSWEDSYSVTARFLDYCNDIGRGTFVADLNRKMRDNSYNDGFFADLLGKPIQDLWADYKTMYNNN